VIANLEPLRVRQQVGITFVLRYDSFEVMLAGEPEQPVAIPVNVIAVKKTLGSLGHDGMKSQLAVDQRLIAKVFTIPESLVLLLIIRFVRVFLVGNVAAEERMRSMSYTNPSNPANRPVRTALRESPSIGRAAVPIR
jgi:hypothetical protein